MSMIPEAADVLPDESGHGYALHGLTVTRGRNPVLDGIDLCLDAPGVVGLIGPNGAGKTTLLKAMMGFIPPRSGRILYDGRPIGRWPRTELAQRVAYMAQGATCSWPLSVERVVALGRTPHIKPFARMKAADLAAIDAAVAATGIADLRSRPVTDLSGGERARVMLARTLAVCPRTLLADEPVAGLDPHYQLQVMDVLRRTADGDRTVLVVLHDLTLAARFCDRLILLDHGRVAADGTPEEVLTPEILGRAYGVTVHVGRHRDGLYVLPWEVNTAARTDTRPPMQAAG